ncbi:flagellar motor protein MotB [Janthinobacterium agaricidamnosum]|uniref:OmpA family protein n=1 Tax=Janthinobacterium agaricidamnosum NBRC 102515 = DSM 9628 TaxID=1349767 RepID=W0V5C8_9BURK|nr:flagellar motor protein MotB [Janthinobacterium agaricidamnosum]CDG82553.1 ompA family protein [Janthinobacterium agaricidamnosum NBRC 102515 = DSM 9628]
MLKPHEKHDQAIIKRSSRKHDEEAHGGAWKVAFADFCLALLSLFLVLWLMAAREQQAMKEIMMDSSAASRQGEGQGVMPEPKGGPRGSLIDHFPLPRQNSGNTTTAGKQANDGKAQPKMSYQSPEDLAALSRALDKLSAEAGLSNNLQSVITPYGLRVMLHDTDKQGMFVRGSSIPTDRFRKLLRQMGPVFAQMENQMLIVGHTDSMQYTNNDYEAFSNWTLSSNRAMSARAQLLAGSMNPESVLQVVGMADRAPLDATNAAAGINRRIELLILTRGQADSVAAMFGVPGAKPSKSQDIDVGEPDPAVLKQLRDKLNPALNSRLNPAGAKKGRAEHAD